jgi:hypothetical protein
MQDKKQDNTQDKKQDNTQDKKQDNTQVALCNDEEGWLISKFLNGRNDFNIVFFDDPINYLSDLYLLVCHSTPGYIIYRNIKKCIFRLISYNDVHVKHLLTCFYDTKSKIIDPYIRVPGFTEDGTYVLYKMDINNKHTLQHNDKYCKKLRSVRDLSYNLDVKTIFLNYKKQSITICEKNEMVI